LPRATPVLATSMRNGAWRPAGAPIDHGLVPTILRRPPHGAIAGPPLVAMSATQPCSAAMRVKYMQVPKWFELRTATTPTPCSFARRTASFIACAAIDWPMPSRPSSTATAPASTSKAGVPGFMVPARSRSRYQPVRSTPCDWWPHKSAWTSESAIRRASAAGTAAERYTCSTNRINPGACMATRRNVILSGLAAALPLRAFAQDAWPSRPIRVVVGHAAGGGVDILARNLGEHIRPLLGQPFVVENRPGANGMIGAQTVAQASADGYTLLMASAGEIAISPHLFRKMAYDPLKDLQPVTLGVKVPNVLTVHPSVPAKTAADLIDLAKKDPGKLTYGSSGIGNLQHLNGELFNALAGTKIVHVPYKGAAPQIADLAAGQITMGYTSVAAALGLIRGGKLRPIAVTSKERVQAIPDVPALAETPALAAYELNNWFGLFAPAGMPPAALQTLHAAAVKALTKPELQKTLVDQGGIPSPGTPDAFRSLIVADSGKFAKIIRDVNIPMEG